MPYIRDNTENLLKTDGFVALPRDRLKMLLRDNGLSTPEIDIFRALLRWGEAECKRQSKKDADLKEVISDLLPLVRFPLMEINDIATDVTPANLFDQKTVVDMFAYLSSPEDNKPATIFNTKPRQNSHVFVFDTTKTPAGRIFSNKDKSVLHNGGGSYWTTPTKQWVSKGVYKLKLKVDVYTCCVNVGVIDRTFSQWSNGAMGGAGAWSFRCTTSSSCNLVGPNVNRTYGAPGYKTGDTLELKLDMNKRTLSYSVNNRDLGEAFSGLPGEVAFAVNFHKPNDKFTIL